MDGLKTLCSKYLASKLDIESVTGTLLLADMHQAPELKAACIEFMTEQSDKVMATEGWKAFLATNRMDLLADLFKNLSVKYHA